MKSFFQFLNEARESQAVMQAKRLGLTADGHGGWYNAQGEFTAKTVGGKLKFYNQNQVLGKQDPPQDRTPKNQQIAATQTKPSAASTKTQQQEPQAQQDSQEPQDLEVDDKGILTVAFGRFNPPTKGHQNLFNKVAKVAAEGPYKIYPSRSQDPKKNPLDPDTKIALMRQMYPKHGERIVNDENIVTIFDVLQKANEEGYTAINIVVGADRQKEFEKLANQYNGELYDFSEINVIPTGKQDADSDKKDNQGISSSLLRKAAAEGDFETFRLGIPKSLDDKQTKKMFMTLQKSMELSEGWNLWQIAPKLDFSGLRNTYITEEIFKVGQFVENLNTGMIGEIIRRGANHLICVTKEGWMFKSWIKDVNEWTEVSGVPANQREVGTDAFRKYAMKMTHTKKIDNFNIKNFINRHKKK
jgi:nicotinic acid mononucleotide adenylyltransferase